MDLLVQSRVNFIIGVFGPGIINKGSISVSCPQCCADRPEKKKLIIRIDTGMHHCWICDLKGSTLRYTIKRFSPEKYTQYLRLFENKEYQTQDLKEEYEEVQLPKSFIPLAMNLNAKDPDVRATINYIFSRGLTERDIFYYRMGTATSGRFRRRVIMPSFNSEGSLNYFTARAIDSDIGRKYLNSRAPKKNLIFNEINVDWKRELTLVEGPFDLVKCDRNAVPLLGSSINEKYYLFQKIVKNKTPILMALDPDASEKMEKICKNLHGYGIDIRVLDCDGYEDVGSMSKEEFLIRKANAENWKLEHRLYRMIKKIKSGSII